MARDPLIALLVKYRDREGTLEGELRATARELGITEQVATKLLGERGGLGWIWDTEQRTPDTVEELVQNRRRRTRGRERKVGPKGFEVLRAWASAHGIDVPPEPGVSRCPHCGARMARLVADLRQGAKP